MEATPFLVSDVTTRHCCMLYPEAFKVNMPVIARSKISWGYRGLDKQNFVTS